MRWRVPLGSACAILYLLLARPDSIIVLAIAAGFVALGCTLRGWASGYLDKGRSLASGGPYAYVRNPLYVGSFFIAVGFCAVLWRHPLPAYIPIAWAVFLTAFLLVYLVKAKTEERELRLTLGDLYENYARQVPAFVPWHGKVKGLQKQSFDPSLYWENREYQCLLGSAGILLLLLLRHFLAI